MRPSPAPHTSTLISMPDLQLADAPQFIAGWRGWDVRCGFLRDMLHISETGSLDCAVWPCTRAPQLTIRHTPKTVKTTNSAEQNTHSQPLHHYNAPTIEKIPKRVPPPANNKFNTLSLTISAHPSS